MSTNFHWVDGNKALVASNKGNIQLNQFSQPASDSYGTGVYLTLELRESVKLKFAGWLTRSHELQVISELLQMLQFCVLQWKDKKLNVNYNKNQEICLDFSLLF